MIESVPSAQGVSSSGRSSSARDAAACCHCGAPCPPGAFAPDGKAFCCLGCRTVFGLLQENGLGQFYELNATPGTRIRAAANAARWAFLDDPAVREKLLDYADAHQARVTLQLPAIHCVACVWLLENLFKLHPGIGRSVVNFSRREAAITFAPEKLKFSELAALLAAIGYEPQFTLGEMEKARPASLHRKQWLQIGLAGFAFGNIMLLSLPVYLGLDSFNGPWFRVLSGWLSLALALPVVTYGASDFWRSAWTSGQQRAWSLDVPIVFGLAALYLASAFDVLAHRGPGYCDSLSGLVFLLLCGRWFQKKTYDRLTFDRDYRGFFPLSVVRKTDAGEETVAISRLQPGDHLILRNGELLPADAKLVQGGACLDYSFVTGESEPVARAAGDHLYAGGRQVGGVIEVETIKPVAQSYLASLWNNAAFRKSRDNDLDSLTNRYSRRFTKLVIGIASAAAAFWFFHEPARALNVFTAVLIVACPCALALAAPLTHGTAQRLLARWKIFLKNALVIERMAGVDTVVLDKTGTLTTTGGNGVLFRKAESGKRKAGNDSLSRAEAQWISSLARHSTHPNSIRIAKALGGDALPVADFKETPGGGVEGDVAGHRILLGSHAWISSRTGSEAQMKRSEPPHAGSCVAIDNHFRGGFEIESSLRPEVETLMAQLGGRFELALLSGDNERDAERFRQLFGKDAVLRFNQSPADKLDFIRELQQRGRKVMMVGDGLNDAGALQQADVGVAVVENIGAFSPASDVILDAAQLPRLAAVLRFSRQAARVVRAGFALSAVYNVIGISVATAGLLQPMVCAVLMPLSSATVTLFACGMTAWLGRKLDNKKSPAGTLTVAVAQASTFNAQPLAREAA